MEGNAGSRAADKRRLPNAGRPCDDRSPPLQELFQPFYIPALFGADEKKRASARPVDFFGPKARSGTR